MRGAISPTTRARRAGLVAAVLLACAAALGAPDPVEARQEGTATVLGRAHDEEGGAVYAVDVTLERDGRAVRRATTDRLGTFRLDRVPAGRYDLVATRLGYEEIRRELSVARDETVEVRLTLVRAAVEVPEIRVEAERSRERERFEEIAGLTIREIDLAEIKAVPGIAEADPIRAVQVLPGVVSTSDFSSAFHVRGGSADQNLVLLDGIPIFSPFHLGGFFSVFNADMVERAELASGGFPARHGGRVSSVLSIESDAGEGELSADAGISLLASRLAVGGGLDPGLADGLGLRSGRWRVSARRSYFDVLLGPVFDFPYHLTDLQGVFEGWTPGGDRITVTVYSGADVLDLTRIDADDFPLRVDWDWGNDLVGARWLHPRRGGGSVSVKAGYTRFGTGLDFPDFDDTRFRSRIDQALLEAELDVVPGPGWRVRSGLALHRLSYDNLARTGGTVFGRGEGEGWLAGAFAQAEWRRPGRWLVEAGLRLDSWTPVGEDASVRVPSPRLALKRFLGDGSWAVKAAAGRYSQFLHSLRDEELPVGIDVWILAGERAPHVESDQLQLGVEGFVGPRRDWYVSLEGYHRSFDGVVTVNPADDPNDPLDDILRGEGTSYGADLLVRRARGAWNGWLALSWLRATRTFADAFSPFDPPPEVEYPPIFDRRVDLDLVLRFPLPAGWQGGLRWNVGTGIPYTRPVGSYAYFRPDYARRDGLLAWTTGEDDDGVEERETAVRLGDRNGARYPAYHRLDLSARRTFEKSWGTLVPYVDLLNVYNRRNVLFYFFEYERDPPVRSGISMFPLLPSIGLEVSF